MVSRLRSWTTQSAQDSKFTCGSLYFQENFNSISQYPSLSPLATLGNFSSPPPALLTKLMPQPALKKFCASNLDLAMTPLADFSSGLVKSSVPQRQSKLPSSVSISSELSNEQAIWNIVLSKVQAAVAKNQAKPELLEELKGMKDLGHSVLRNHFRSLDSSSHFPHLEVKNSNQSEVLNAYTFSENEHNNNGQCEVRASFQDAPKKGKSVLRANDHTKAVQMHGREFPIQVLKLKHAQSILQPRCAKCESTANSADSQTSVVKSSSIKPCPPPSSVGSSSCNLSPLDKDVAADSELSFGEQIVKVIDDFDTLSMSSASSLKSVSIPSIDSTPSSKRVENGCSLCFAEHKNYCVQNNLPWPQQDRFGCWRFHSFKDGAGNVVCPKLQHSICGLCFATGAKAHFVENCPLLVMSLGEC